MSPKFPDTVLMLAASGLVLFAGTLYLRRANAQQKGVVDNPSNIGGTGQNVYTGDRGVSYWKDAFEMQRLKDSFGALNKRASNASLMPMSFDNAPWLENGSFAGEGLSNTVDDLITLQRQDSGTGNRPGINTY